jgi:hypothetical protein
MDRKDFEMSAAQFAKLMEACKPQMYLVANGTEPDVRGTILRAWDALGDEMGFVGSTALPIPGKSHHFFTAVEK